MSPSRKLNLNINSNYSYIRKKVFRIGRRDSTYNVQCLFLRHKDTGTEKTLLAYKEVKDQSISIELDGELRSIEKASHVMCL